MSLHILNPRFKYIPAASTNIQRTFEENGHTFKDNLHRVEYDFSGLNYWAALVAGDKNGK